MSSAASSLKRAEARAPLASLTFRNRQRDRRLNLPFLRRILRHVLTEQLCVPAAELCFHFVSAEEMARVNWQFLQHEGSTDVITFDYVADDVRRRNSSQPDPVRLLTSAATPLNGEAFICVADAVKQAREFGTSWQSEVIRYAVHALLHLCGYDDLQPAKRRVMKCEENRLMRELAQAFDLDQLQTPNSKP
ncbi:MAG: hypothetical protein FD161_2108 [Limisphaerales bacterium]|nr:MAG: hypothetical protein FD161_2108 [Limisphaerales bacterium]KAG0508814.1 MAG: hypothetical protein E1N63_1910 [Limisphaerales bacterium]TXT49726.1 MAG: hypothetical protein FD140_2880 [Limisphaerales bacterium]